MTCRPLMCDHSAECPDLLCPGRPVTLHRVPGFYTEEGGRAVSGGFGVSLSMPIAEVPEPIPTPEQAEGWALATLVSAAVFALACFAAVVRLGVQLSTPL